MEESLLNGVGMESMVRREKRKGHGRGWVLELMTKL